MSSKNTKEENAVITFSRRDFMKYSGIAVAGVYFAGCDILSGKGKHALGFILVDMKKCQGCMSCMLACSLAHEGVINLSLSRIQVVQNCFAKWPDDILLSQCRHCMEPACVAVCPANALKPDFRYGYVITVDEKKCIGCKQCLSACPFPPHKPVWNFVEGHSQKCDLCAQSTYWKTKTGLRGKKACVEICPVNAITFTTEIPEQIGDSGYNVDLRGDEWEKIGFPKD